MKGVKARAAHYRGPECPDCHQLLSVKERIRRDLYHGRCCRCAAMRMETDAAAQVRRLGPAGAWWAEG